MQLDKGCCVSSNVSIVHTDHNGMNKYCFMKCAYTCSNLLRKKELLLLNLKPRQPNVLSETFTSFVFPSVFFIPRNS